ncbi:MAG: hypothetical protein K0R66_26 [Gammaproteobacteria bacterium]|jgi:plasmid stability protein|nr:hypothetical protein [Gammaproteobacteria bacterium]
MANLSIRKLDDAVYERLQRLAAEHSVSMEEEARRILSQAVAAPGRITDVFEQYFGQKNGIHLDELDQRKPHDPMDLS